MLDMRIMMGVALVLAGVAAVTDSRSSTIPNWLTLPVLITAPLIYGLENGPVEAMKSVGSALTCGLGPYVMFRLRSMGGGDVKLLAALGAATGPEPWLGLHIQALSFVVALCFATSWLAVQGELLSRLRVVATSAVDRFLPEERRTRAERLAPHTVRMGLPIFASTALHLVPRVVKPWIGW